MKMTKWICDSCQREISGVVYTLTCYAEDIRPQIGISAEAAAQNVRQNLKSSAARHLCRPCKDKITDGMFVV